MLHKENYRKGLENKVEPKISIIMGIYNCASTLEEAISSILNQTYTDWEFILCDDGSVDKTYEIAYKYGMQDPEKFIVLKNEKNMGLNYTLNRCIQVARGEYIARMDGDDLCDPDRLRKQLEFLEENPHLSLVGTEMAMFDEEGEWGKTRVIEYPETKDFCKHAPFFSHATIMIRKNALLAVQGYTVDKRLLRVEDCHLWYKLYANGYKGANIAEPLYKVRDDRNAIGRRTFKARMNGIYVTWVGFRMVKMPWYNYIYALRTTISEFLKAIMPRTLYKILHKIQYRRKIKADEREK